MTMQHLIMRHQYWWYIPTGAALCHHDAIVGHSLQMLGTAGALLFSTNCALHAQVVAMMPASSAMLPATLGCLSATCHNNQQIH
jgi:hypothetical protein